MTSTNFRIALIISFAALSNSAMAQNKLEQFFQDAMKRVLGDQKLAQLKAITRGTTYLNRSWDITNSLGAKDRIVTTAAGACLERPATNYKVCSNYDGNETARIGFGADKQAANGEYASIVATPSGLVIEWSYRDCSTGYTQTWAMGNQLLSNGMGPVNTSSRQEPAKCEGA